MKSRISSKGQVTVPADARNALGLVTGTEVEFLVRESEIVLRKSRTDNEPVDRVYGMFPATQSTDRLLEDMRGPGPSGAAAVTRRRARRVKRQP